MNVIYQMSLNHNCCLCWKPSNSDFKMMQNQHGECTEVYDVTVKYFDPMIITSGHEDSNGGVLCQECWIHIKDFHEFQQAVLKSRSLLLGNGIDQINVKEEETLLMEANEFLPEDNFFDESNINSPFENAGKVIVKKDTVEETLNMEVDAKSLKVVIEDNKVSLSKNEIEICIKTPVVPQKGNKERKNRKNSKAFASHESNSSSTFRNNKSVSELSGRAVYTLEKGRESDTFIAQWKPNLECDLCPTTADNFDKLRSHFREVHQSRFYIKCCDRKFYRRCILVDHIRLHVNPDTHKCDICGKSSTSKYNLKLHKQIVHNEVREYECEICHKNFNHKPTLERHLLTHATGEKEFFCKECGKGYVLEVQLTTHMRNVHNGVRVCEQCGKTLHSVGALKKHLMEHGILPQPKFPCNECGVELKSNEALKRHKAAYHHDGSTVYVCSICGKVAASEHALLSHKKFVHEDKRKHKCTFCDKAFRTRIVLREHIATHTGEDLYQCPHCPQTFKTNANMHHHRKRVHPVEWKEARRNRLNLPKVNIDKLRRQVIL